jgi:ribose 1,5-bisphosphokinase
MSEAMADVQRQAAAASGLLVLIVGPSGAGKDTLLAYAKARLGGRSDIVFARRLVTRPADATEDHEPFDVAAFEDGLVRRALRPRLAG